MRQARAPRRRADFDAEWEGLATKGLTDAELEQHRVDLLNYQARHTGGETQT